MLLLTCSASVAQQFEWTNLPNSPVPDSASQRFEDVYFVNANTGFIAMYSGRIYKTVNGGQSWSLVNSATNFPFGNYRSLGFFNSQFGLLGNISFANPLMRTTNGGLNWTPVSNFFPRPYGICGISVVDENIAYGVGRYAAPAHVIKTTNKGATWTCREMDTSLAKSLVDCYFWSADSGIAVGGYNRGNGYQFGNAVVLQTFDGGNTWQRIYRSNRSGEWCWKINFVDRITGYISIERHSGLSYILKTTDGGLTWNEKTFLVYDQEGIGFIDENHGWVGGWTGPTYETTDGGDTWDLAKWGYFVNRFRFLNDTLAYAVGERVYKYVRAPEPPLLRIAAIGDYGLAGTSELNVSKYLKSWKPELVITLGNNNYESGEASTIDANIGQYYSDFIYPYTGNYGTGDTVNRFFPATGEVDWYTPGAFPFFDYFQLPGNERYYDFVKGNVHFFCINSDPNEPDGVDSSSVQAQWLKQRLSESSSDWNIVYFHNPPYSSGSTYGSSIYMQWPFKDWGASAVISGSEHSYERITVDGFTYFVNGLGGRSIFPLGPAIPGSEVRYNSKYGFMVIDSYQDRIDFSFSTSTGLLVDKHSLQRQTKSFELKVAVEGLADSPPNPSSGFLVNIYLRKAVPPYEIADSGKALIGFTGTARTAFTNVNNNTDYYIVVRHLNSIETWSKTGQRFVQGYLTYDFTDSASKAYGDNQVFTGNKFCIYSGDCNQDGSIDLTDQSLVDNDIFNFVTGFSVQDLNSDGIVDLSDMVFVDNNAAAFVSAITP